MKLTEQQRCLAAAILGISNAGADHLFRGPRAEYGAEDIKRLLRFKDDVDSITTTLVRPLVESEEQLEMFQEEARSWYKTIEKQTLDKLSAVYKDYAHLFEAMRG